MAHQHRNILVVDDHPIISQTFELLFREHTVVAATTGKEAVFHARTRFFDLYIIDYSLPDVDGRDLAMQIRSLHSEAHIAIYTGHAEPPKTGTEPWDVWIEKAGDVPTLLAELEALM